MLGIRRVLCVQCWWWSEEPWFWCWSVRCVSGNGASDSERNISQEAGRVLLRAAAAAAAAAGCRCVTLVDAWRSSPACCSIYEYSHTTINRSVHWLPVTELLNYYWWRLGLVVARWSRLTKLLYSGTGFVYWDGWPSASVYTTLVCNQPTRPTQPSTLSRTQNEYRPKCGDALRLGEYVSFHLWINVWVTGNTVWSLVNTCHTWAL